VQVLALAVALVDAALAALAQENFIAAAARASAAALVEAAAAAAAVVSHVRPQETSTFLNDGIVLPILYYFIRPILILCLALKDTINTSLPSEGRGDAFACVSNLFTDYFYEKKYLIDGSMTIRFDNGTKVMRYHNFLDPVYLYENNTIYYANETEVFIID
jgi:hypothetical protein